MSARRTGGAKLSRRRFVALVAGGTAALAAGPGLAAVRPRRKPAPKPAPAPAAGDAAIRKEFERQRAQLAGALRAIRTFRLPPGGDLPVVFRPLRAARPERPKPGSSGGR